MDRGPTDPFAGQNRWEEGGVDVSAKNALDLGATALAFAEGIGMIESDGLFRRNRGTGNRAPPSQGEGAGSWETTGEAGEQCRL